MGAFEEGVRSLVEAAADAGVEGAWKLEGLTPRQIELEIRARSVRMQQRQQEIDLLAYLVGRYVLLAMHAPRRYPRRPDGIMKERRAMNDDEIKRVFVSLAQQRRE